MTARIVGFDSRATCGLVAPRSVSRNISPDRGGLALHYGGPAQRLVGRPHSECRGRWRAWQQFHLSKGWVDLAYTGGACLHGYALAGRGAGVRTAANGSNDGNQRFYAVCALIGQGEAPTDALLDAIEWWALELRTAGGADSAVASHSAFTSTGCPGPPLVEFARHLDHRPITAAPDQEDDMQYQAIRRARDGAIALTAPGYFLHVTPEQWAVAQRTGQAKPPGDALNDREWDVAQAIAHGGEEPAPQREADGTTSSGTTSRPPLKDDRPWNPPQES